MVLLTSVKDNKIKFYPKLEKQKQFFFNNAVKNRCSSDSKIKWKSLKDAAHTNCSLNVMIPETSLSNNNNNNNNNYLY